jgi:hypothetical protein
LFHAAWANKADLVKRWHAHALTQHFNEKQKSIIDDAMPVLSSPGPRDDKFWLDAFQRPVGLLPLQFLMADVGVLAAQGKAKQIEDILAGFRNAQVRPVAGRHRAATELQIGRVLESLRRHGEAHAERVKIARELLAGVQTPDPGTTEPDTRVPPVLYELPAKQGRREALRRLNSGQVKPDDFVFWGQLITLQPNPVARARLAGRLFNATVRRLHDDYDLSRFLFTATFWFDMDNDTEWRRWKKAVRRFSDPQKFPQTAEVIACLELRRATRTGTATQLAEKLARMKVAFTRAMRQRMVLRHTLTRRDLDGLRQAIDDLPAEALADPDTMRFSLAALTALDRNAELDMVKRRAKRLLYEEILEAWHAPTYAGGARIASLTELLNQEAAVPAGFDAFMVDSLANSFLESAYLARRANSQGQWLKAVEHSTVVIDRWPTFYWFHWIKGRALAELNQKSKARPFLETYIQHSRDEPEVLVAEELLN